MYVLCHLDGYNHLDITMMVDKQIDCYEVKKLIHSFRISWFAYRALLDEYIRVDDAPSSTNVWD